MALLTPTEARRWIPTLTGTGEDATIADLITTVGALVAQHLGYEPADESTEATCEATTYVLYLDGPDAEHPEMLRFPRPLQSVTSVYDDPDRAYGASTLVASTDYDLDKRKGLVILKTTSTHGEWSESWRAIKATVVCGYASGKIPEAILTAAGRWVAHLYAQRHGGEETSTSAQGASVQLVDKTIPAEVKELLASYRMWGGWCG